MPDESPRRVDYAGRHQRFGWWTLFVFTALGLVLELFHGFKIRTYLDVSNETRRLMWTLAHAHGTLLAFLHVLFGVSVKSSPELAVRHRALISSCFVWATILLPGGFFLGGISFYAGDPGLGVLLVPVGATLLLIGIVLVARGVEPVGTAPALPAGPQRSRPRPS